MRAAKGEREMTVTLMRLQGQRPGEPEGDKELSARCRICKSSEGGILMGLSAEGAAVHCTTFRILFVRRIANFVIGRRRCNSLGQRRSLVRNIL